MPIFRKRTGDTIEDNFVTWPERGKPNLAALDQDIQTTIKQNYAKSPSLDNRLDRLTHLRQEFAKHHDLARQISEDYLAEYCAIIADIEAEREKLLSHRDKLDKIEASLPKLPGGRNEIDVIVDSAANADDTCASDVESGSVTKLPNNRRC